MSEKRELIIKTSTYATIPLPAMNTSHCSTTVSNGCEGSSRILSSDKPYGMSGIVIEWVGWVISMRDQPTRPGWVKISKVSPVSFGNLPKISGSQVTRVAGLDIAQTLLPMLTVLIITTQIRIQCRCQRRLGC